MNRCSIVIIFALLGPPAAHAAGFGFFETGCTTQAGADCSPASPEMLIALRFPTGGGAATADVNLLGRNPNIDRFTGDPIVLDLPDNSSLSSQPPYISGLKSFAGTLSWPAEAFRISAIGPERVILIDLNGGTGRLLAMPPGVIIGNCPLAEVCNISGVWQAVP